MTIENLIAKRVLNYEPRKGIDEDQKQVVLFIFNPLQRNEYQFSTILFGLNKAITRRKLKFILRCGKWMYLFL